MLNIMLLINVSIQINSDDLALGSYRVSNRYFKIKSNNERDFGIAIVVTDVNFSE